MKPRLLLAAVVACSSILIAPANADEVTTVSRGLTIPVETITELDIDQFQSALKFQAAQDVVLHGHLIVKKGDLVEGRMGGVGAKPGFITSRMNPLDLGMHMDTRMPAAISIDDVVNYCGDTIRIAFQHTYQIHIYTKGLGMFAKTHIDAPVLPAGTVFAAQTDRVTRNVCADKTREANPPLAANMVPPNLPSQEDPTTGIPHQPRT